MLLINREYTYLFLRAYQKPAIPLIPKDYPYFLKPIAKPAKSKTLTLVLECEAQIKSLVCCGIACY